MPTISVLLGITIGMFWDERGHQVPHFYAVYGKAQASIDLDRNVIAGSLSARQRRLVREWARLHRGELQANWERTRRMEPLDRIEPLS